MSERKKMNDCLCECVDAETKVVSYRLRCDDRDQNPLNRRHARRVDRGPEVATRCQNDVSSLGFGYRVD